MVVSALGQRAVAYYRVRIPDDGLTFMFDLEEGRVLICGSRSNRNPDCRDPSSYEWRCETNSYCNIHVKGMSRKCRQISTDFMFVSIEGVEKTNKVTMEVVNGDETISEGIYHSYVCICKFIICSYITKSAKNYGHKCLLNVYKI